MFGIYRTEGLLTKITVLVKYNIYTIHGRKLTDFKSILNIIIIDFGKTDFWFTGESKSVF